MGLYGLDAVDDFATFPQFSHALGGEVSLNRRHGLAQRLELFWTGVAGCNGGTHCIDLVRGQKGTASFNAAGSPWKSNGKKAIGRLQGNISFPTAYVKGRCTTYNKITVSFLLKRMGTGASWGLGTCFGNEPYPSNYLYADGVAYVGLTGNGLTPTFTPTAAEMTQWHTLTFVHDCGAGSNGYRVYRNGVQKYATTANATLSTTRDLIYFGASYSTYWFSTGDGTNNEAFIAAGAIWSRALTKQEVNEWSVEALADFPTLLSRVDLAGMAAPEPPSVSGGNLLLLGVGV